MTESFMPTSMSSGCFPSRFRTPAQNTMTETAISGGLSGACSSRGPVAEVSQCSCLKHALR